MRDIKFRAWDNIRKEMINYDRGEFRLMPFSNLYDKEFRKVYTFMQYTGLKDKNDVEIYEGDIVSFTLFDCFDNDVQHIGKILFNNGAFYIEYMNKYELYSSLLCYVISQDDEFEVIGNIYENLELLKED